MGEALFSLHQQERDVSEHHSSDVDYQLLAKHLEDFQLLEHQVQEIKNNKIEQCMHHQWLEEDVMKPTTISAVTGSTTPIAATCSVTTSVTARDFSAAASSSTTPVSAVIRPPPIQTSSADQISVLDLIDKVPELNNCVATPRTVIAPKAALTHSSVTIPSLTSKSTLKVAGLESVTSSVVFPKHDMQPWEGTTTSVVTGSATPSTATPT